jgi:hypothetical protein
MIKYFRVPEEQLEKLDRVIKQHTREEIVGAIASKISSPVAEPTGVRTTLAGQTDLTIIGKADKVVAPSAVLQSMEERQTT